MRHLTGIFLALVMAAVLYAGAGWGAGRIEALRAHGTSLATAPGSVALAVLAAAGLLAGVLVAVPAVSPLAAGLPGLALVAWSAYLAVSPRVAEQLIPLSAARTAELGFRALLASGILALLGTMMIIPLFVPSRWRGRDGRFDDRDGFSRPSASGLLQ
jgi:hypothetical protein